jgi:hypothetical protein
MRQQRHAPARQRGQQRLVFKQPIDAKFEIHDELRTMS